MIKVKTAVNQKVADECRSRSVDCTTAGDVGVAGGSVDETVGGGGAETAVGNDSANTPPHIKQCVSCLSTTLSHSGQRNTSGSSPSLLELVGKSLISYHNNNY